jgi:multidrug resistance efflux pump
VSKKLLWIGVGVALVPVAVGVALAIFDIYRQAATSIISRDAQVMAQVVQVQSPFAGQVTRLLVDVGDTVAQGDLMATLSAVPSTAAGGTAAGPARLAVNVRAPADGTVLGVASAVGGSVTAGQALLTIGDLENLWVIANVEEGRIGKIHEGQSAGVHVQAVEQTLGGQVVQVSPATAAVAGGARQTASASTASSGGTRATQTVPVRIALDPARLGDLAGGRLLPGMSAEVTIFLR